MVSQLTFLFDFSVGENNFNEFDSHGCALRPLFHKPSVISN